MLASRFAKPLSEKIKQWVDSLILIQDVLEAWLKCQATYLYLDPIFSSEDIMQQMPDEGVKFRTVHEMWCDVMKLAHAQPLAFPAMRQEDLLERLNEANAELESIMSSLNAYLETKRLYFPRFFFLSNDELLEILAETKDPHRVQKHLSKCFEGIAKLEFNATLDIRAMFSSKGERLEFQPLPKSEGGRFINPMSSGSNVEVWLLQVESSMRAAVSRNIDLAVSSFKSAPDNISWVRMWSQQAALAVSEVMWTSEIGHAIASGGPPALRLYGQALTQQLQPIIKLVRGVLTTLDRGTFTNMVVLAVHKRDVVQGMAKAAVNKVTDFEWVAQLRYTWFGSKRVTRDHRPRPIQLKMINAEVGYACEYLGNSGRLVITPLTDRCYRTLMGAIHMNMGGAPEGPAGTGKTETTKDLAKAAGMMCVVFNCSEGLDHLAMAKFFKGLASCGAWACFDEFNRIELEVLSVIAQQILTIQRAKRSHIEKLTFQGTDITLNRDANIFITMNPGYAGRAELPDNLKALFRSVAMMVPDYSLIAEIMLYSNGYVNAREMARKIVATYKLCSEQLSSQDHYDYGMRAVIAVLRAASVQKQLSRDEPEEVLVLRAIVDVNLPKFLSPDIPLFKSIVHDLFPRVTPSSKRPGELLQAITDACKQLQLQPKPEFVDKVVQLFDTMSVRHGFMIIGKPWAGKTAAITSLKTAMDKLAAALPTQRNYRSMQQTFINPKALTLGQLYGCFDDVSHEWTDGVLCSRFREAAQGKSHAGGPSEVSFGSEARRWLVFDGPIDSLWIENMNTVLDDNKKLCLMSGEIIQMSDTMSMVFEASDLAQASPATVSRCGMVYMEPQILGWRPLVHSWLDFHMDDNPKFLRRFARTTSYRTGRRSSLRRSSVALTDQIAQLHKSLNAAGALAPDEPAAIQPGAPGIGSGSGAGVQAGTTGLQARGVGSTRRGSIDVEIDVTEDTRGCIIDAEQRQWLQQLVDWLLPPCLMFMRTHACEFVPVQDATRVMSLLNIFAITVTQVVTYFKDGYRIGSLELTGRKELQRPDVECLFVYSLMWGFASTCDNDSAARFGDFLRLITSNVGAITKHSLYPALEQDGYSVPEDVVRLGIDLPRRGSVFDYVYCAGDRRWKDLEAAVRGTPDIDSDTNFADIIIPTVTSERCHYLASLLLQHDHQVLVCGPSGTGKSVYMSQLLRSHLPETFSNSSVNFSATTKATFVQKQVELQLERVRRGVYGPRGGSAQGDRRHVVFLDDFNMPAVEQYGAQPPLELLRQLMDKGGWYDTSDNSFKTIRHTALLAAMAPVGGGRNATSPRTLRHFNVVGIAEFNDATMRHIFSAIVKAKFYGLNFSTAIKDRCQALVDATMIVYKKAVASLLPTPTKSHYTFNLRDFGRVVAGLVMATPEGVGDIQALSRLWVHETSRVFTDRLNDAADIMLCQETIRDAAQRCLGVRFSDIVAQLKASAGEDVEADVDECASEDPDFAHLNYLLWGDYTNSKKNRGAPVYREFTSYKDLLTVYETFKSDHNSFSKAPLDVVFFAFFVGHANRIARLFSHPRGNALLVGVGGSGKRSAARFAAYMSDYRLMQIELTKTYAFTDWREDLKRILREAGTFHRPVVFMLEDNQIRWEAMVEDVNNLLNSGMVPNLYAADERAEIVEKMRPLAAAQGLAKDISDGELYELFVSRMRRNVHLALCMSPAGDNFRSRLRKYPALVNNCTIDWFFPWPRSALRAVGNKSLADIGVPKEQHADVVSVCTSFHEVARAQAIRCREQEKRFSYVTPTSYLELFTLFRKTLHTQRKEVVQAQQRYEQGLAKLAFASGQVSVMRQELVNLAPVLESSAEQTQELMQMCQERLPVVERTRKLVERDRNQATKEARAVERSMQECTDDLSEALPILNSAIRALNTLTSSDITAVKAMLNPPAGVRLVMSAVCIMLQVAPDRVKDVEHPTKKIDDFWGPARRLLADYNFLDRLKS